MQDFGARAVAEAARGAGAGLTHMSALGANVDSPSLYAASKGRGEQAVLETIKDAVIIRPSIIFGPEDNFFNQFANIARMAPALPLIGGGETKFQPVYVGDVAEAIARSVDGALKGGQTFELGGSEVLTFRQCMERMLEVIERKRFLLPVPFWASKIMGTVLGALPGKLLTADQVTLLESDNVVSEAAVKDGRTLPGIGITPASLAAILPTYLWRFRKSGQFQVSKA